MKIEYVKRNKKKDTIDIKIVDICRKELFELLIEQYKYRNWESKEQFKRFYFEELMTFIIKDLEYFNLLSMPEDEVDELEEEWKSFKKRYKKQFEESKEVEKLEKEKIKIEKRIAKLKGK